MKYFTRLKVYKASNVLFDPINIKAYSYGWWLFVCNVKDKTIFNMANYSSSTIKHQYKVRNLMICKKISIDLFLKFTLKSLDYLSVALKDELRLTIFEIKEINNLINKKGTWKTTNEKRKLRITSLVKHYRQVKNLLSEV